MVKTETSPGFLVSFLFVLIGNSTIMWAISSLITLRVLRCIPLLQVSHGEDRNIARFSCFFFNLVNWQSTIKWAISSRITLRVLRCILLLEVSHGEDRNMARFSCFFFNLVNWQFYHQVSNKFPYHSTCVEMYTVTWGFTWERLSMTFTANGKWQGGPRDQFFPWFFMFAGCSLPFSTQREVVSRRWKTWVKSVLFWAVSEILTILFVKARLILSFIAVKQLSFTDFIRKLWKKWNRKLRTVLCF